MKNAATLTRTRERTRFVRFLVVGTIGAGVDFGTFNLLTSLLHVQPLIAQSISFVTAVLSNFIWNRYWTYPDSRSKSVRRQIVQFFIVNAVGLAIRTPIFALLEKPLTRMFAGLAPTLPNSALFAPTFLGHNAALAFAVGVVLLWNFFVNRYWTYNDVS